MNKLDHMLTEATEAVGQLPPRITPDTRVPDLSSIASVTKCVTDYAKNRTDVTIEQQQRLDSLYLQMVELRMKYWLCVVESSIRHGHFQCTLQSQQRHEPALTQFTRALRELQQVSEPTDEFRARILSAYEQAVAQMQEG